MISINKSKTVVILAISLLYLGGCASLDTFKIEPREFQRTVNYLGKPVVITERWDQPSAPPSCGTDYYACGVQENGKPVIYRKTFANMNMPDVMPHELAHAIDGMQHTAWVRGFDRMGCATVVVPGKGYPLGATLCITAGHEFIVPTARVTQKGD